MGRVTYDPMGIKTRLSIIGGGNMGSAVAAGAIAAEVLTPDEILVVEPDDHKRANLARQRVHTLERIPSGSESYRLGERLLLAVKPQTFAQVAADLAAGGVLKDACVLSIMAGVTTTTLRSALPGVRSVIRLMPNLPASVGQGISAITFEPAAAPPAEDLEFADRLFSAIGAIVHLPENLMDAYTALAGSGPAYVFYLAEALLHGARTLGFSPAQADVIVRQTLLGSAVLLAGSDHAPAELRAAVTSKGGTTSAAAAVLDQARVMEAFDRALVAARDRGRELNAS